MPPELEPGRILWDPRERLCPPSSFRRSIPTAGTALPPLSVATGFPQQFLMQRGGPVTLKKTANHVCLRWKR